MPVMVASLDTHEPDPPRRRPEPEARHVADYLAELGEEAAGLARRAGLSLVGVLFAAAAAAARRWRG